MNCELANGQLSLMLYGELSFEEEELVQQHLDGCEACRAELVSVKALHRALDDTEAEMDGAVLADCRRTLRVTVAAIGPQEKNGWFHGLTWGAFLKPLGAFALITVGFFGARFTTAVGDPPQASIPMASRVRYVEPGMESGRVQIVVEETSQRTLSGETASEPIRRLLLAAARDSSDAGLRVESMDILRASAGGSAEVRKALIFALQHDPNSGVRLKALDGLKGSAGDPETRHALSQVLLADDNPGVRTQAIDLLTQKKEPSMVGVLQELMRKEDNGYVRLKCQKALHEMNASVETF
ncbi:MAG: HEAT repeat domain-containing protein [Bryobacteraceae bacterium]